MNSWLSNMERKFGRYAIKRLTMIMIILIAAGYILMMVVPNLVQYMELNIDSVLHGQVWRLVTWLLIPPSAFNFFTILMLFFYFSIGTSLERTWGDFRYNVYIFGGILITLVVAFITYAAFCAAGAIPAEVSNAIGMFFSTYYICMSILLAYAATFPDAMILLMFIIPVKMKYFGWIYAAFMAYDAFRYIRVAIALRNALYFIPVIAMLASVLNFLFFYFFLKPGFRMSREQKRRQQEFFRQVRAAGRGRDPFGGNAARGRDTAVRGGVVDGNARIVNIQPRHRCEICGRTDITDPDLEFRFCSKCAGSREYCMDHLYTHEHVK